MSTSSSSPCKLVLKLFIFIVAISIPVVFTEYKLRHNSNNKFLSYKNKYDEIVNNKTKSDIIIIGSSHGNHDIIPGAIKIDGHSIYNFCFAAGSPSFNYDLYTNLIRTYYQKPKLIIYDVNSLTFDNNRLNRTLENDFKFMPIGFGYLRGNSNTFTMPYNYLHITHESDIYKALLDSFKNNDSDNVLIQYYDNGFVPYQENFKVAERPKTTIYAGEIEKFESLIKLITSQNIAVFFVETPEYAPETKDTDTVNKVNKTINDIAARYSIPYLNYNRELKSGMNDDKRYFSDQDHLNFVGARIFSEKLSSDLNKLLHVKQIGVKPTLFPSTLSPRDRL